MLAYSMGNGVFPTSNSQNLLNPHIKDCYTPFLYLQFKIIAFSYSENIAIFSESIPKILRFFRNQFQIY